MTVVAAVIGYLVGSLPTAGLLGRLVGVDLRAEGSGNPGTRNALRTSGPLLAVIVLVVEAAKGYVAVVIGVAIADDLGAVVAGIGAVAGNVYNVWYRFKGGKGLGISLGVLLGSWPVVLVPIVAVMAVIVLITRSSGFATLVAVGSLLVMAVLWQVYDWPTGGVDATAQPLILAVGIAVIISPKHWRDAHFRAPAPG